MRSGGRSRPAWAWHSFRVLASRRGASPRGWASRWGWVSRRADVRWGSGIPGKVGGPAARSGWRSPRGEVRGPVGPARRAPVPGRGAARLGPLGSCVGSALFRQVVQGCGAASLGWWCRSSRQVNELAAFRRRFLRVRAKCISFCLWLILMGRTTLCRRRTKLCGLGCWTACCRWGPASTSSSWRGR